MGKKIQIVLLVILFVLIFMFYKIFFLTEKKVVIQQTDQVITQEENLNEISLSSMSGDTDELEDIDTIISDLRTYFEYLYNVIEQRESE